MRRYQEERSHDSDGATDGAGPGISFRPDQRRPGRGPPAPPLTAALRSGGIQGRPTLFAGLAKDISFVIKAPVSMLLWPILTQHLASPFERRIKILHVIRDGRDIALSQNQSPVIKFFNLTYPHEYKELLRRYSGKLEPVRGMKLWSDWNTQAMEWATTYASNKDANVKVQYLLMRSEDLLPGSLRRRQALQALAEFIGSTLSNEQLCCLTHQKARDYGKSVTHNAQTLQHNHPQQESPLRSFVNRWREQERNKEYRESSDRTRRGGGGTGGGGHNRKQHNSPKHHNAHRKLVQHELNRGSNDGHRQNALAVASKLIQDVENWKHLAETTMEVDAKSAKVLAIQGLIDHGHTLLDDWKLNKKSLMEMDIDSPVPISKQDIFDVIEALRVFQEEVRITKFHKQQAARPGKRNT
jgi:hypothetical protein